MIEQHKGKTAKRMVQTESTALIRVVGIGGAGNNAVDRMIDEQIAGVNFVTINTDQQDLGNTLANQRLLIGERITRGLGSGGKPELGLRAAEESLEELHDILHGSDMVFITAGMGGGTGTGASPLIAKVAREEGALTIGVVTKPFSFEGSQRMRAAETGIEQLKEQVDTLIVIPNDRLLETADRRLSLVDSFKLADDVLRQGIQGISELITVPGLINLDFADVRAIMSVGGAAMMAIGTGKGEDRARIAAEQALSNRLLDVSVSGARGILFNVTGGSNLSLYEINQAASVIRETAHPDVNLIFGAVINDAMQDEVRITVIATGFDHHSPLMRQMTRTEPPRSLGKPVREARHAVVTPDPVPAKQPENGHAYRVNDLDIPAFLRKRQ
jgi:cell division protein FtsZ